MDSSRLLRGMPKKLAPWNLDGYINSAMAALQEITWCEGATAVVSSCLLLRVRWAIVVAALSAGLFPAIGRHYQTNAVQAMTRRVIGLGIMIAYVLLNYQADLRTSASSVLAVR